MIANYKMILGIITSVLGVIIGGSFLFKKNSTKGNKNNSLQSEKDINSDHSFNTTKTTTTVNASENSVQNIIQGNQTVNNLDFQGFEVIGRSLIETIYPHTQIALKTLNTNCFDFLAVCENEFKNMPKSSIERFSETDVQFAFQNAIKAASIKNCIDTHQILAKLLMDRVEKEQTNIVNLAIDESINTVAKLGGNLIKMISLIFLFSRTILKTENENVLCEHLSLVVSNFMDIDPSIAKLEYLEAISCGKLIQFISNDFISIMSRNYPCLFFKEISLDSISKVGLPENYLLYLFREMPSKNYKILSSLVLSINDNTQILSSDNIPIVLTEDHKNKLKIILRENRLTSQEIEYFLYEKVKDLNKLAHLWNKCGMHQFSLTAVGIAIGRAYLEKIKLGNYDINIWIN